MAEEDITKRLHYFNHQFLVEADFTDEQQYHLDRRRRHNRLLHGYGVADGLQVEKTGDKEVTVRSGTAVDREGREIVQVTDQPVDLSDATTYPPDSDVYVIIAYAEQETDPSTATGVTGNTRITETPTIEATTTAPPGDGSVVRLVHFVLDGSGNVPGGIGDTLASDLRQLAGAVVAPGTVGSSELADGAVTMNKLAELVQNSIATGENHATRTDNPHGVTAQQVGALLSVDGVSNPGGNIDLLSTNAVTISPNNAGNQITIGENHSERTDNPHGVTIQQIGALPLSGGTVTGELNVRQQNATFARFGTPSGSAQHGLGKTSDKNVSVFISAHENPTVGTSTQTALMIWPVTSGVKALHIIAASGGVDTMTVAGTARFTGEKIGYVVDTFVNGSGRTLHTGDIVKLKPGGAMRFQGDNNRIPVTEVTVADSENDTLVIGIVNKEATPAPDEPDNRTEPDDPTFVPEGGELFVVTLGTFSHCKVDATEASIEVGDLLTSSSNPGHAKKATEPKIGAIIGKALEPLKEGTGYIAVFVNIQ